MNASTAPRGQSLGRPKDMEKRAAILNAARHLFTENTYDGTNMDAVAADAGVSKLTVYSHFGGKENLFLEVVRDCVEEVEPEATYEYDPEEPVADLLLRLARQRSALDTNPQVVKTLRVIIGDCRQGHPRFGHLIWDVGPARIRALLAQLLTRAQDDGKLNLHGLPVEVVTMQLISLIHGDSILRRLCGCVESGDQEEAAHQALHVEAGVQTFLRAFAAK